MGYPIALPDPLTPASRSLFGLAGLATTGIAGDLTLTKPGTTARAATFPDADIEVQATAEVISGNWTARNHAAYNVIASATATDPATPAAGHEFTTLVRNGTLTTSRGSYAVSGTLVRSVWHSGSWTDYPYGPLNAANTWTAAQTIDRGNGTLPSGHSAPSASVAQRWYSDAGLNAALQSYAFGGTRTVFEMWSVGGTREAPSATPAGTIFSLFASGHDGTNYVRAGGIDAVADGMWSGSNRGQYWLFGGVPAGSTTAAEWMRLQNGNLVIGGTPTAGSGALQVFGECLFTGLNANKNVIRLKHSNGAEANTGILFSNQFFSGSIDAGMAAIYGVDSGSAGGGIGFYTTANGSGASGVPSLRAFLDNAGNLVIGGTPTAGNGLLQRASGTTRASGDAWGTDTFLWRDAANSLITEGAFRSTGATGGIGYATGAGGTVTQATSKSTVVTLSKVCGTITLNGASLAANTGVSFTWTNTAIAANDLVLIVHDSVGTLGAYGITVTPGSGTATVTVRNNTAGALAEAIVLRFAIIKAATT